MLRIEARTNARALRRADDSGSSIANVNLLKNARSMSLTSLVIQMVGMLADRRAVPALAAALLDLDPEVRRDAAEALELLGIPVGVEVEAPIGR